MPARPIRGTRRKKRWVPGERDYGLMTSEHKIMLKLNELSFHLVVNDTPPGIEEYGLQDGILPIQTLMMHRSVTQSMMIRLSELTEEELISLKQFFNDAIDSAIPASRVLYENAKENHGKGNQYYPRLYRQVPVVVDHRGPQQEYSEGVLRRPDPDPQQDHDGDDDGPA